MLRDITIGQYFPGTSVVHRTDPRLKLVLVIAMIVTLDVYKRQVTARSGRLPPTPPGV